MPAEYRAEPFFELLDAWVLHAIGHLDAATQARLTAMEPELRANFGGIGPWYEVISQKMKFDPHLGSQILGIWAEGADKYLKNTGQDPDPVEFAQAYVNQKMLPGFGL